MKAFSFVMALIVLDSVQKKEKGHPG